MALKYDGFISYSHAADGKLAPALQRALHLLAKPWYQLRALHIFRDETSLSANPALWSSIEKALSESKWFIYLGSPGAAQSQWVTREIRWWLSNREPSSLLMALTEGTIQWDNKRNDFDWDATNAVPRDGSRVLTASSDGTARVYDISLAKPLSDLIQLALERMPRELTPEETRQYRP